MFEATKGRAPGQWWPSAEPDGRTSATLYCPNCGRGHSLAAHTIKPDGSVSPSCDIPPHFKAAQAECPACTFHDHVRLVGWIGGPTLVSQPPVQGSEP